MPVIVIYIFRCILTSKRGQKHQFINSVNKSLKTALHMAVNHDNYGCVQVTLNVFFLQFASELNTGERYYERSQNALKLSLEPNRSPEHNDS